MKKINLIIIFIIFSSCISEKIKNKLPVNSATLLLKKRAVNSSISQTSSKNIDIINGFRELKLGTHLDSLYLEDWNFYNYSSEIKYYDKKLHFYLDDNAFKSEVYLTFYFNKLIMIDIELNDNRDLSDVEYSASQAANTFVKPKLMDLFNNIFGEPIEIRPGVINEKKLERKDFDKDFLSSLLDKTFSKEDYDLIEITQTEYSNKAFIKCPFELIIKKYKHHKSKKNNKDEFSSPGVTYYPSSINNKTLYSYNGSENVIKLFIENHFEWIDFAEETLNTNYKLKKIKTQIKFYNKKIVKSYMLSKNKKDSIASQEFKRNLKKRKISEDSLKLKKSLENF
jgi:hypothetical protein